MWYPSPTFPYDHLPFHPQGIKNLEFKRRKVPVDPHPFLISCLQPACPCDSCPDIPRLTPSLSWWGGCGKAVGGQGSGWSPELTPHCGVHGWSRQWHITVTVKGLAGCSLVFISTGASQGPGGKVQVLLVCPGSAGPMEWEKPSKTAHAYLNQRQFMLPLICDLPQ